MQAVLFNVRLLSELPLATALATRFAARGHGVVFCSEDRSVADAAIQAAASRLGARYVNLEDTRQRLVATRPASLAHRLQRRAERVVARRLPPGRFVAGDPETQRFIDEFSIQLSAAAAVIAEAQPGVVIVSQDGMSGNAALIHEAHRAGIPVVDCPYGFGTSRDFDDYLDEKAREQSLQLVEGPLGARIARDYPQWIRTTTFGDVTMFPAGYILAREHLGLTLPLPWVIHGGSADLLAAESEAMQRHYLAEGIDPRKVKLTGTPYCDAMMSELDACPDAGAAYRASRKIKAGHTSVLLSLPPSLHSIRGHLNEFNSYESACEAILTMIADKPGVSATVSLHPNAPPGQRAFVDRLGLPVSDEWVISAIPKYDVFFTTFSSTIRWAIACGKPVLNYNMYGYNNHDYDAVTGVATHRALADIAVVLDRLLDDGAFAAVAARQKEAGLAWGIMDGRNFDRIYDAVTMLVAANGIEARR